MTKSTSKHIGPKKSVILIPGTVPPSEMIAVSEAEPGKRPKRHLVTILVILALSFGFLGVVWTLLAKGDSAKDSAGILAVHWDLDPVVEGAIKSIVLALKEPPKTVKSSVNASIHDVIQSLTLAPRNLTVGFTQACVYSRYSARCAKLPYNATELISERVLPLFGDQWDGLQAVGQSVESQPTRRIMDFLLSSSLLSLCLAAVVSFGVMRWQTIMDRRRWTKETAFMALGVLLVGLTCCSLAMTAAILSLQIVKDARKASPILAVNNGGMVGICFVVLGCCICSLVLAMLSFCHNGGGVGAVGGVRLNSQRSKNSEKNHTKPEDSWKAASSTGDSSQTEQRLNE